MTIMICLHVGILIYHHAFQRLLDLPPRTIRHGKRGRLRFEVVNLRAVSVRYADNALYVIYTQNSAFAECLYPCPNRRVDNPEQFADFPLGHGGCTYIARQVDIALLVHRDNIPFFFHRYSVLIRWVGRYSSPYLPICATEFPCLG